jgi:hypothetical protein
MQPSEVVSLNEVRNVGESALGLHGALAAERAKSPWQRIVSVGKDVVEVWRESRVLEQRLLGAMHFRRIGHE